ncbi:hypothetical protein NZJ93_10650 [Desulfofundulus thermocisternus]|nr:hypothetical protein [Desulfofundulus thermocisternus]
MLQFRPGKPLFHREQRDAVPRAYVSCPDPAFKREAGQDDPFAPGYPVQLVNTRRPLETVLLDQGQGQLDG